MHSFSANQKRVIFHVYHYCTWYILKHDIILHKTDDFDSSIPSTTSIFSNAIPARFAGRWIAKEILQGYTSTNHFGPPVFLLYFIQIVRSVFCLVLRHDLITNF